MGDLEFSFEIRIRQSFCARQKTPLPVFDKILPSGIPRQKIISNTQKRVRHTLQNAFCQRKRSQG